MIEVEESGRKESGTAARDNVEGPCTLRVGSPLLPKGATFLPGIGNDSDRVTSPPGGVAEVGRLLGSAWKSIATPDRSVKSSFYPWERSEFVFHFCSGYQNVAQMDL